VEPLYADILGEDPLDFLGIGGKFPYNSYAAPVVGEGIAVNIW
jgi:hypothetical protein